MLPSGICQRGLVGLGSVIVALAAADANAQSPTLRYGFRQDQHYAYDLKITSDHEEYTDAHTGYCLYQVTSVKGDRIGLRHRGRLDSKRDFRKGMGVQPGGIVYSPVTFVIDRQGKRIDIVGDLDQIPDLLDDVQTLVLESLPSGPQDRWRTEDDFRIQRSWQGLGPLGPGGHRVHETVDYQVERIDGDLVWVNKQYLAKTTENQGSALDMTMTGKGKFAFDQRKGMVTSVSMSYRLSVKTLQGSESSTMNVSCRLADRTRLAEIIKEVEEAFSKTPTRSERAQALKGLRSRNPLVVTQSLAQAGSFARDDRPDDFASAIAPLLKHPNPLIKYPAAVAMTKWATPKVEAVLIETFQKDTDPALRRLLIKALPLVDTEEAARAIATQIEDNTSEVAEALKAMGSVAEKPTIELLRSDDVFVQEAACELLAEIGGPQSVIALEPLLQSRSSLVSRRAKEALATLKKRVSADAVEAASRQSSTPSPASQTEQTAISAMRTWTNATGKFRVEAKMLAYRDGKVVLERKDGKRVAVPLEKLSQSDQQFVASVTESPSARSTPPTSVSAKRTKRVEMAGGQEGWPFRDEDKTPLLGITYGLGSWDNEQTVGRIRAVFDRPATPRGREKLLIAREGYAVGAINVDAQRFVNAMQIVFMRLKRNGRLDPGDSYTSDWIGFRTGRSTVTIGGTGAIVVGIHGRHGAILNAVGLVFKGGRTSREIRP